MDDDASHRAAGTDLVPLAGANGISRELSGAVDVALGAGSLAWRTAATGARIGWGALRMGARIARALPGGGIAARAASATADRLADDGARMREEAVVRAQRALEEVVPAVVELIDVDAIVRRVDVDALVGMIDVDAIVGRVDADALIGRVEVDALLARVDLDALLARADVNALLERVDVDAFLAGVDLDTAIARVDVDAIAARVDVNAIVQRVDVDAVVEETELGTIVARSTSGFASEALDAARAQTVGADTLVTRIVERVLRRRGEAPLGPPLLVQEEVEEEIPPGSTAG